MNIIERGPYYIFYLNGELIEHEYIGKFRENYIDKFPINKRVQGVEIVEGNKICDTIDVGETINDARIISYSKLNPFFKTKLILLGYSYVGDNYDTW